MRFEVEFDYPVPYVRSKCRNTEVAVFRGRTEIQVEETPLDSTRLVFEAGCEDLRGDASLRKRHEDCVFLVGGRPARFLEIEGRLYRERCLATEFVSLTRDRLPSSPLSVSPRGEDGMRTLVSQAGYYADDVVVHDRASLTAKILSAHHSGWRGKPVPAEGVFRTLKDDGGDAYAAAIRDRATELRVVDGSLFAPASEPVLYIDYAGATSDDYRYMIGVCEARDNGWSRFGSGVRHPLSNDRKDTFPIDAGARALERLAEVAEKGKSIDLSKVGFLDASAIQFDGASDLRSKAGEIMGVLATNAAKLSPEILGPLIGLRDVLRGSPSWLTPEIVESVREVLDAVPARGLEGDGFNNPGEWDEGRHSPVPADVERLWADDRLAGLRKALALVEASPTAIALDATAAVPATEAGNLIVAEVVSGFEAYLVMDSLRFPGELPARSSGDTLLVVEDLDRRDSLCSADRQAAFLFDAEGQVVLETGKAGAPPSPAARGAAMAHHAALSQARADLGLDGTLSAEDLASLSFD